MYHSDFGGDIVSLLVLGTPANGGESLISSTYSIYNYLAQHRPDIIKVLTSPEGYKRKGFPEGAPLIFYENDELITSFSTRNFIGFGEIPRDKSYPLISSEERDAVGGFNAIAYKYTLENGFTERRYRVCEQSHQPTLQKRLISKMKTTGVT